MLSKNTIKRFSIAGLASALLALTAATGCQEDAGYGYYAGSGYDTGSYNFASEEIQGALSSVVLANWP